MLRCLSGPRTFCGTNSGSIVCIRVVRMKDEDSGVCCAATPVALCSVWVCLLWLVAERRTEQGAGKVIYTVDAFRLCPCCCFSPAT